MNLKREYGRNVTSQDGEDGIIEEIFRRLNIAGGVCMEFGAWDGKNLSNTWTLWHERGFGAVLVEAVEDRAAKLKEATRDFHQVQVMCAYVQAEGNNSVDGILSRCGVKPDIELVSIDVDGDDYHIFSAIREYHPRVVVVEYNATMGSRLKIVQAPGEMLGSSGAAIIELAHRKGYKLAACTNVNLIFCQEKDFPQLGFDEPILDEVYPDNAVTIVITGYGGNAFLSRRPWHVYELEPPPEERVVWWRRWARLVLRRQPRERKYVVNKRWDGPLLIPVRLIGHLPEELKQRAART